MNNHLQSKSALKWGDLEPLQKITLLDMKKYRADWIFELQWISPQLSTISGVDWIESKPEYQFTQSELDSIKAGLERWTTHFKYLGFSYSLKLIPDIVNKLKLGVTYQEIATQLEILDGRVDHEIDDIVFGFIPKDKVDYFENNKLFGDEVYKQFPSARQEIKDAGTCYAHNKYNATVFHLMRAVEIAAKLLVKEMKAEKYIIVTIQGGKTPIRKPVELCDWGTLIKGLERALVELEKGARTNTQKKDKHIYFSEVVGSFRNFKDAWRNPISHSATNFLAGQTKDILESARHFMTKLAERVGEKPK